MTTFTESSADTVAPTSTRSVSRTEVEDFLFHEAAVLDEWRLDEWITLFVPGAHMQVPTTDQAALGPESAGYFVADDWDLIQARVKRLKSRKAHAENPHSRTNRLIGNVRVLDREGDTVRVAANFVIHRYRDGGAFCYVGRYDHLLQVETTGLRFLTRRSVLSNESMDPGARLSFIV
ncbi:p-cumate dioxygenase small subunit [Rhodococcus rhodochrous]|uniref:aromatic-ring-hydroxylating dioxygenase subunit beta n=1 Tax=Rhodococcus rhodochrous TaxID=1829 RepID=UPI0007514EC3|nr:aromatic-ring-hydroxylating dioxygenase subunit beta [Rhodococcus rhodochrous]MDO1485108.1 aromatic-ring-hydroxylating dioxygenase subunit beta [Rhodococcus rhodochrous]SNV10085.1 p-cumate dioxygenase small subunit [Rhodococcus rhodochrous]